MNYKDKIKVILWYIGLRDTLPRSAINAVEMTAPFKPLPSEYKRSSVDIQFTFDYNVFGVSGY